MPRAENKVTNPIGFSSVAALDDVGRPDTSSAFDPVACFDFLDAELADPDTPTAWRRRQSNSVSVARAMVGGEANHHSLKLADSGADFHFSWRSCAFGHTTFHDFSYTSDAPITASLNNQERDHYLLVVPVAGQARAEFAGEKIEMRPGAVHVFGPSGRLVFLDEPPFWRNLLLRIERQGFESQLCGEASALFGRKINFSTEPVSFADRAAPLLRFLKYLVSEISAENSLIADDAVWPSLERSLFKLIAQTVPNNLDNTPSDGSVLRTPKTVEQAERFIETEYLSDLDVATVAEAVGVSARSLHYAFQTSRGYSPMSYLLQCRLGRAHHALLSSDPHDTSVAHVATDCGFSHLSKFAAAYRRHYGELPSQTLKLTSKNT